MRPFAVVCLAAVISAGPVPAAQDSIPEVARLLTEVIRIDTSNPPGNEAKLAEFLKSRFAPLGFEIDLDEPGDPARSDVSPPPDDCSSYEVVYETAAQRWSTSSSSVRPCGDTGGTLLTDHVRPRLTVLL